MPDLGDYAVAVLGAYAATLGLLGGLVAVSFWRSRRVRQVLREIEGRSGDG